MSLLTVEASKLIDRLTRDLAASIGNTEKALELVRTLKADNARLVKVAEDALAMAERALGK